MRPDFKQWAKQHPKAHDNPQGDDLRNDEMWKGCDPAAVEELLFYLWGRSPCSEAVMQGADVFEDFRRWCRKHGFTKRKAA